MRRSWILLMLPLLLAVWPVCLFAQNQASNLAASLTNEEKLIESTTSITQADIARMQHLVNEIQASKDDRLLARAQLMLALFKERLQTKASTEAFDEAIKKEAASIRSYRWHRTKKTLVKTGFWVGLSSLSLVGVSQAVENWATDNYLQASTLSQAKPYFVTGRISQLTTIVGIVGGAGGLGMAWLLSVNPFDVPSPSAVAVPLSFPSPDMSTAQKTSYLEGAKKDYQARARGATRLRTASFACLAAGVTGLIATGITGYLGNLAYNKYTASTSAADATSYHNSVEIYQYITIGTASLAFLGLTGASIGYLLGPDPSELKSSIAVLNSQLEALQGGQ